MPVIFIVDGVVERVSLARYMLEESGCTVEWFGTAQAFESAERRLPDLFLIATNLPDCSGIELCRRIRIIHKLGSTRIILLADGPGESYRSIVESGADDFITTPFARGELISCVQAAIRSHVPLEFRLSSPDQAEIVIDSLAMTVKVRGKEISTTALEFSLIDYMARHRGKAFTRDALLDAVWGATEFVAPRSVDSCVGRIRRKIEPDQLSPKYFKTIRGVGYKLDATAVWEENSSQVCHCMSCTLSRDPSRMTTRIPPRRTAT